MKSLENFLSSLNFASRSRMATSALLFLTRSFSCATKFLKLMFKSSMAAASFGFPMLEPLGGKPRTGAIISGRPGLSFAFVVVVAVEAVEGLVAVGEFVAVEAELVAAVLVAAAEAVVVVAVVAVVVVMVVVVVVVSSDGFGGCCFCCCKVSGRTSWEAMMAGSCGAPGTVGCPVGARRAGGVYLFELAAARAGAAAVR